jgi:hypothetical protein
VLIHAVSPPTQPFTLSAHRQQKLHCIAAFHCANIHSLSHTLSYSRYLFCARTCACLLFHSQACTKRPAHHTLLLVSVRSSVPHSRARTRHNPLVISLATVPSWTVSHPRAPTHTRSTAAPHDRLYLTHVPTHAPLLHHMMDCISPTCTHPHTLLRCCTT